VFNTEVNIDLIFRVSDFISINLDSTNSVKREVPIIVFVPQKDLTNSERNKKISSSHLGMMVIVDIFHMKKHKNESKMVKNILFDSRFQRLKKSFSMILFVVVSNSIPVKLKIK
jgi:hypothetical protein